MPFVEVSLAVTELIVEYHKPVDIFVIECLKWFYSIGERYDITCISLFTYLNDFNSCFSI